MVGRRDEKADGSLAAGGGRRPGLEDPDVAPGAAGAAEGQPGRSPSRAELEPIIRRFPTRQAALNPILRYCRQRCGGVSPRMIADIADHLGVSAAQVCGVVSFDEAFAARPSGQQTIEVCTSLSCHLRGSKRILERLDALIGEQTSTVLLQRRCFGRCELGPVVQIDRQLPQTGTRELVSTVRRQSAANPTNGPHQEPFAHTPRS